MTIDQQEVTIYTDGACSGNPGPGGWGAILFFNSNKIEKRICGSESYTTNNKMELMAVIQALKVLKCYSNVQLYTDSIYVKNGITLWIHKWKISGWKTANKLPVKNMDLWLELDKLALLHNINWYWVKAHVGNKYNEEVDMLARNSIYTNIS
ncbi:ribonuclease HI [Neoehrlichia mikurensis]|uniref:Ribonuclease H n=1 Tax=Neoehrlichia mikurensis TaxID=89586 RepID=A0A9Q9F3T4_9RICK|nr:ribonuclease HI [Neoehrlichia mikurensis]QXK91691.1 ribonuclease HI [Neoehrlichia mikurensis]QXK92902.1 ribonuclease HI [Neoehrlichia mikurensis]QXK93382.1 ribonuclease HI [Neoehrlichia mikurensis]UTO55670.1 ribonuclease HI [Neoehrlichia mikurensis]UTO56590.1 ribonuclease HI [Neoehrlichia mikurensis]